VIALSTREQTRLLRGGTLSSPTEHDELGVEDAALVARARLGERLAYAELYRRHVPSIYDFCFHRLGTRETAEDATQAVFLRALRGLDGCDRPDAFRSWLFGIARHIVIDVYRAKRRDGGSLDLTVVAEIEDPRPSLEHLAAVSD
jgi:DNA-directed RNA polymerase specialized sigma24 family protein